MEYGLSLGSNLNDRLGNLVAARRMIAATPGITLLARSAVYETEPVDVADHLIHMTFLNAAVVIESLLPPEKVHARLHTIEDELGRLRGSDRNAPRTVDIDIIYADGIQICTPHLILPHPRWSERRFVVQPLADIRPDLVIASGGMTVQETLLSLPTNPGVIRFAEQW